MFFEIMKNHLCKKKEDAKTFAAIMSELFSLQRSILIESGCKMIGMDHIYNNVMDQKVKLVSEIVKHKKRDECSHILRSESRKLE